MLENIESLENLLGLARRKSNKYEINTINSSDVEKYTNDGWQIHKQLKNKFQIKKVKDHLISLEDRVWSLFYKMKFSYLSGNGGALLKSTSNDIKQMLNVVAIDDEVAIMIYCISSSEHKRRNQLHSEISSFHQQREPFTKAIKNQFYLENGIKRQIIQVIFLNKIILSESDREKAKNLNIILFDEHDLAYYENLINHLGPAAKYQTLADMIPGKSVAGLEIKIPAIKTKMGGFNCYSFSISPEYLLKIAYVSHRSKGKASDINTYQRMMAKSRLKKIRDYITEDGIFPTNIILNFEKGRLQFQRTKQETELKDDLDSGILGWLDIKPAYKSAWVIDGQHRLYAYSGHEKAQNSKLSVLAFEGLKPSTQAELFIDINAKQKSVKQSLLQELFAELHWDSDNPLTRISAIVSKAIQDINNDPESSLYQRIQTTDGEKDNIRCITLTSMFGQIEKKGFFIQKEKGGHVLEFGPLWGGDNMNTLKRTVAILNYWINEITKHNKEWWDLGSNDGGGLAMNDGIATIIAVLRSVFEDLEKSHSLIQLSHNEVNKLIAPYANSLGQYLASFDNPQKKAFRDLRGAAGVSYRTRQCQEGIRSRIPTYNPEGLDEWINLQKQQTNKNAKDLIDKIEISLQDFIINELKSQHGIENDTWWYDSIPSTIRTKVSTRMEEDKNKRGGKEYYFDLIDYKKIILENWEIFEQIFSYGKGNKDKKTDWLDFINETRKIVAHASSGKMVSLEDFSKIQDISNWITQQVNNFEPDEE